MIQTHQAVVLERVGQPLVLKTQPLPQAIHGSAVVKVLSTQISPNADVVFSKGTFPIPIPLKTPVTPSAAFIGRIHDKGVDATKLKPGQLVFVDFTVLSRDDRDDSILQGYITGNETLESVWRHGSYAEYAQVPLEAIWSLDEDLLVNKLGYSFADLNYLGTICIAMAGLLDIDVRPGDSVIVAPATGYFGGSAVHAALALGARVVAAGRNEDTLSRLKKTFAFTGRLEIVKLQGDVAQDTAALRAASGNPKGADRYLDYSPPEAQGTQHVLACLSALRPRGKCVLMGSIPGAVEVPYLLTMRNSLTIQGRCMFDHWHGEQTLKLIETGYLKLGPGDCSAVKIHSYKLAEVHEAVEKANEVRGWGSMVVLEP